MFLFIQFINAKCVRVQSIANKSWSSGRVDDLKSEIGNKADMH